MAHSSFADHNSSGLMFYPPLSLSSDASSLTAIAHQLLNQKQYCPPLHEESAPWQQLYNDQHHLHQEVHGGSELAAAGDPWSALQFLRRAAPGRRLVTGDHFALSQAISRSTRCADAFSQHDVISSCSSYFLQEPTSVLDHLSSPSLDSMHSPHSLTSEQQQQQQFHDMPQSLQEDVCMGADQSPAEGKASDHATSAENRATEGRILEQNTMNPQGAGIRSYADTCANSVAACAEDLQAVRTHEEKVVIDRRDSSSEWIDCLMNEAGPSEVGIASCFDRTNPCLSADQSMQQDQDLESWREDFAVSNCSLDHNIAPNTSSWSTVPHELSQPCPADFSPSPWSDSIHLLPVNNLPCTSAPLQQPHQYYPPHLLGLPPLWPFQDRGKKDLLCMFANTGVLGANLERKGGQRGLKLLQILIDCVKYLDEITVAHGSLATPGVIPTISPDFTNTLMALTELSSPYGDPLQRVTCYFTEAIAAGLASDTGSSEPGRYQLMQQKADHDGLENMVMAFRTLNEAVPYVKFAHLTANQAILEATEGADTLHIIDWGIVQGVQWSALLQALALVRSAPLKIKITGIASPCLGPNPSISLSATGKRLKEFAASLNLDLEFRPVCANVQDLDASTLRTDDPSELVVVNFMFQLHYLLDDSLHHLRRALRIVRQLNPSMITLSEYDVSINANSLHHRFINAFCFYAGVFDSLEARMGREDPDRMKIERLFFAKEIRSMMTMEGSKRQPERRESSDNWRRLLENLGFRSNHALPTHYAVSQARLLLRLGYGEDFTLLEGPGWMSLGWLDRPIVRVSAWHCC